MVGTCALESSPRAFLMSLPEQLGCLLGRYLLVMFVFVVTCGKYNVLGRLPAAVLVLFSVLESGITPTNDGLFLGCGRGLRDT